MIGIAGMVGKALPKAPIPPLAKAGLILGTSIGAGVAKKAINS
jgi:hypothetical protein